MSGLLELNGARLALYRRGAGRPILYLHPEMGLDTTRPVLELLTQFGEVIAPSAPGFDRSDLPRHISTVEDLSYTCLDLIELLDLRDVIVIGSSFGGWLAATMAVKSCARIGALVLSGPYGTKWGGPEEHDIADMFWLSREEFHALAYVDPTVGHRNPAELDDAGVKAMARNWEAAALFGWLPYMHDPKLRHRLHRINVPTLLLSGESDRVLSPDYMQRFAAAVPGSTLAKIPGAGHYPDLEQPELFAQKVGAFVNAIGAADQTPPFEVMLP